MTMEFIWYALLVVGGIGSLVTGLWFLYLAFQQGIGWGLLCFVPFGGLVVLIKFWHEMKRPFLYSLAASAVFYFGLGGMALASGQTAVDRGVPLSPGDDFRWEPQPATVATPVADELYPEEAHAVVDEFFEDVEEFTPTPEPTPDAPPEGTLRTPLRRRGLTSHPPEALARLIDRQVMLILNTGDEMPVYVESVEGETVYVRRKVGGGSIVFPLQYEDIREVLIR